MKDKVITKKSVFVFSGRVFDVVREDLVLPSGKEIQRDVIKHPGAVVFIPQGEDGELYLVRQYRHAVGKRLLEFPAGTLEAGESPEECARREIAEEVGFQAEQWTQLGCIYPTPGICSEKQYLFLARDLRPFRLEGDDDEDITVEQLTVAEFEKLTSEGAITDSKSISAFTRARLRGLI